MTELDLQALWQEQPLDPAPVRHEQRAAPASLRFAVPTSQFQARPRERSRRLPLGVLAFAVAAALVVVVLRGVVKDPPEVQGPPRLADPASQLEALLAECRTYSDPLTKPDWSRAEQACQRALDLEPIHHEAGTLLARIGVLRACEVNLELGSALASTERAEEALRSFEKVGKECESYFVRAIPLVRTTSALVQTQAGADCKRYAASGQWEVALPRCELYARLSCGPTAPGARGDPLLRTFLDARRKLQPGAAQWRCPRDEALRAPPPSPDELARETLARRYAEPALGRALVEYFNGNFGQARVVLQKLLENVSRAQFHATARALLGDIDAAAALATRASSQVQAGQLEVAAESFRQALELDARLMLGDSPPASAEERSRQLERMRSSLRRTATDLMSEHAYQRGKDLADRKDFRAACRAWKVGLTFSRSSIDLLKALTNVCTKRAAEAFDGAQSCEQLRAARDFAVDGDGLAEKIAESLSAEGCR